METVTIKGIEITDAVIKNINELADDIRFAVLIEEADGSSSPTKMKEIINIAFGEELAEEIWEKCGYKMSEVAYFFKDVQAASLSPPEKTDLSNVSRWE